jgi:hypothetical protein
VYSQVKEGSAERERRSAAEQQQGAKSSQFWKLPAQTLARGACPLPVGGAIAALVVESMMEHCLFNFPPSHPGVLLCFLRTGKSFSGYAHRGWRRESLWVLACLFTLGAPRGPYPSRMIMLLRFNSFSISRLELLLAIRGTAQSFPSFPGFFRLLRILSTQQLADLKK